MFRLCKGFLLSFVLLNLIQVAFALDPSRSVSQYIHEKWGEDRGFVGGAIYAIGQSTDGYLWIGTERGLVRFDGSNFTLIERPIPNTPPIPSVRGFASDASGNLWIRLEGPRMLLYRDGKFTDVNTEYDLQGLIVTALTTDSQRRVFLSGLGERTLRFDKGHFDAVLTPEESPGIVISLAVTRDQSVWLGTREQGLYRSQHNHISKLAQNLADSKINCLFPAAEGNLWIGTDDGLYVLEVGSPGPYRIEQLRNLRVLAITEDSNHNTWIGTDHGVARITPFGTVSTELVNPKADSEVRAIFQDGDGDVWFGGSHGLERLRNGTFRSYSAKDGLTASGGGPLYVDPQGRIWFAPDSGDVFLIENGRARRVDVAGLDREVIYSISGGGDEIWLGRERGGLTALRESGGAFVAHTYTQSDGLIRNSIYAVHRSGDGTVWAGTVSSGLNRLQNGRFTIFSDANGMPSNAVNSVTESANGTIWVATPNGLASYVKGRWENYTARDGLPTRVVKTVYEDSTHRLWIGGAGGLSFLSGSSIKTPANMPDLLREQISGIAEDSLGFLWFMTSDHVVRVNRARLVSGTLLETDIQSFGVEDGLEGSEGVGRDDTIVADHTGRIWLSLRSGLYMADPNISIRNLRPVAVRVESLSAGGMQFNPQLPIRIPPGIDSITVNFGDTSLAAPKRVRFRYRLEGSGQHWSDIVATKQVVLSNLGPGSYTFQIEASNSVGLWNGPDTNIPFDIEPALWQAGWFRVLLFVLLLAILWTAYILRLRHVTTLLYIRHRERLSEREDIARDLHDTFFQSVQSLFLRLHTASRQLPSENPARQTLEEVLDESDRVMTEGREMFLDVRTKSRERDFAETITDCCVEFATAYAIEYRIEIEGQPRSLAPLVTAELGKIAREAIYNAFRHSRAKAIEVQLTYGKKLFQLRVRDDGRGFEPAHLQADTGHSHLGLQNMRRRTEKLGGNFRLWTRPGSGTEVEVIIFSDKAYRTTQKRRLFPSSH